MASNESDIENRFPSTQLPLTGYFLFRGPSDPFDDPVDQSVCHNTPTCSLSGTDNHVQRVQSHLNPFSSSFWCSCISLFKSVAAAILLLFDLNFISFPIICRTQRRFSPSFISTMQRASRGGGRVWINTNRHSPEEFAPCTPLVRRTSIATEDKNLPTPLRSRASRCWLLSRNRGT